MYQRAWVRVGTWKINVTCVGTYVYTLGNMGITRWFEPWGTQRVLIYTTSSHQLMEEVRWQNISEVAERYFRNLTAEQKATD